MFRRWLHRWMKTEAHLAPRYRRRALQNSFMPHAEMLEDRRLPAITVSALTFTPSPANEGSTTAVSGTITDSSPGLTHTVAVKWGDGSADSTAQLPANTLNFNLPHNYADNNIPAATPFAVSVTVTNTQSASGSANGSILVNNVAPTLSALTFQNPRVAGTATTLTGQINEPGIRDTTSMVINWGDGSPIQSASFIAGTSSFSLAHTFVNPGTYNVALTITDKDNGSSSSSTSAVIGTAPTITSANVSPTTITEGDTVTASGTFTDADQGTHDVIINWNDGTAIQVTNLPAGQTSFNGISHQFANNLPIGTQSGVTQVSISVANQSGGSDTKLVPITVNNAAPKFTSLALDADVINEGGTATLRGTFVDVGPADTHQVTVNWGDGQSPTTVDLPAGVTNFAIQHQYFSASSTPLTIIANVVDDDNVGDSATTSILVNNVSPTVSIGPDRTVNEGSDVQLTAFVSDPGINDTFTYQWIVVASNGQVIPEGSSSTFVFTPFDQGRYDVSLTVTDKDGGVGVASAVITALNVPPTATFSVRQPVRLNQPATFTFSNVTDPASADRAAGFLFSYDFHNDGTFFAPGDIQNSRNPQGTFTFTEPGTYTVRGRVTDKDGGFNDYFVTFSAGFDNFVTGADQGGGPQVNVFSTDTRQLRFSFFAYDPLFIGGVRVATGNVLGNGNADIVTGPGPGGGPDIHVYDGVTGQLVSQFSAFDPLFIGGVYVATGDVDGDGVAEIIVGADQGGGPAVGIYSANGTMKDSFFAFDPNFIGGVRVATGDVTGSGLMDIVAGAGPGGGPQVSVFDPISKATILSYFAYDPNFVGGVYVASGDVNGDRRADIITGPGSPGGPNVIVVSGANGSVIANFNAFDVPTKISINQGDFIWRSGVRVGVADFFGTGTVEVLAIPGAGRRPAVHVADAVSNGLNSTGIDDFFAFNPAFMGGAFIGGHV